VPQPGSADLAAIVGWLNKRLPEDVIVTNGAGNYAGYVHRFFQYRGFRTQLAPTNGSMGYGVPSAVAAKIAAPGRTVVSFSGDGCFLMNGQEFATAVQHGANIVFIVVDNVVRHDPHASGARLSDPRSWHGTQEPRLRAYARAFAATARRSRRPRTSPRRSSAASPSASRRSSTSRPTPRRSPRASLSAESCREQSLAEQKH
jgi:acetolactate synthase-1/2/3 large subunit